MFFCFFSPVQVWRTLKFKTFVFLVPVQVWCTLNFKILIFFDIFCPCAGFRQGVGLQSPPNLHRDKKNTSFELQTAQNLHREKKTKVLNFKVHQTCTGTKKQKNTKTAQSTWEGATIPLKLLFFFGFFCACAGLVHFEGQNPMHLFICILILLLVLADILDAYGIFCFPCSFLKGQVHFSCKGFTI